MYEVGIDHVFIPITRTGGSYRTFIDYVKNFDFFLPLISEKCQHIAVQTICHFLLPPCGNSTTYKPPTAVCKDECSYVRDFCSAEWMQFDEYIMANRDNFPAGLIFLNCSMPGLYLQPLSYCCSDVGVDIRKLIYQ